MRPLETALTLVNAMALLVSARTSLRSSRWIQLLPPIIAAAAVAQLLIEGSRWQMMPAYALSAVLFAFLLLQSPPPTRAPKQRSTSLRIAAGAGIAFGVFALIASAALPILIPVFRFPAPGGPYAIGTLTYHWVDRERPEIFTADPLDHRELMVQLWYPAENNSSSKRAPYVQDGHALAALARLFHFPAFAFDYLSAVTTHAIAFARVASGEPAYPVIIFSHGRGGFRQHNTFQVEALVSRGYIVAAIDHPYAASGVVFPDGRLVPFDSRMFDPIHTGHPPFLDQAIPFLAQDAIFTLDQLAELNRADPTGILTGRLDLPRAGVFGVSLGGEVAAEACKREPRLRACLIIDVFVPHDVVDSGLQQPTMWITRDARSMQLEGWQASDIDETQTTMRKVFATLPGNGYIVLIPDAFHPNFSDFPLFSPLASWLGLIGPVDAQRAHDIINAYSLAFFDRHLKDRAATLLDQRVSPFPEAIFEMRR
ncbi:MAG TPA: carboxylic ester hydrolase [Casimicrobiaceae bacterium]